MMTADEYLDDLFSFISQAPTPYHAVANSVARLNARGFMGLHEGDDWGDLPPGAYYVIRNDSSLIAFTLNHSPHAGMPLRMAGAHTDSPGLKIKPNPTQQRHGCMQLGVEVYGGPLLAPWFDRDLSIAGRVCWNTETGPLQSSLVDFQRPVATIPSLAIHLDRDANSNRNIDKQTDLIPLIMLTTESTPSDFPMLLRHELARQHPEAANAAILSFDLFLYDTHPPCRVGMHHEFITGPRLDNLLSCHALILAMTQTENRGNCLIVLNDHEEVGSVSSGGAQGPFLSSLMERLYPDPASRQRALDGSLFISTDNAHAVHPNFAGKHDPDHQPLLNQGPVIKTNANQRYATSASTAALFRLFCNKAGVPCQQFVMRNDLTCGSTIGPLTAAELGIATVDVGVPQLAMHSIRETAGHLDGWYLFRALATFFAETDKRIRCPLSTG